MQKKKFKKHKKQWFKNRVEKIVFKFINELPEPVLIKSPNHVDALYLYHLDNKIIFEDAESK